MTLSKMKISVLFFGMLAAAIETLNDEKIV